MMTPSALESGRLAGKEGTRVLQVSVTASRAFNSFAISTNVRSRTVTFKCARKIAVTDTSSRLQLIFVRLDHRYSVNARLLTIIFRLFITSLEVIISNKTLIKKLRDDNPEIVCEAFFINKISRSVLKFSPGQLTDFCCCIGTPSWGIAWYINDTLIPEITVERGQTYTFIVEGGNSPNNRAK